MRQWLGGLLVAGAVLVGGGAAAQAPPTCDQETRQLRFLVQFYAKQRADLEFHVSRLEADRQALQAEIEALKSARGQKSSP